MTSGGKAVDVGEVGADELDEDVVFSVVGSGAALVGEGPAFCPEFASRPMTTPIPPRSSTATTAITVGSTHCPDRLPPSCAGICGCDTGGCGGGVGGIRVGAIAIGSY